MLLLATLATLPLPAQTGNIVSVSLDFQINYTLGQDMNHYSGTGTIQPFGSATLTAEQTFPGGVVDSKFVLSSGDTFSATSTGLSGTGSNCVLTSSVSSGTGIFANASGSFGLNYNCSPDVPAIGTFHATGTGTITLENSGAISESPAGLTFSFLQGAPASSSQSVFLSNQTAQAIAFSTATGGQNWLSVSPPSHRVPAFAVTALSVTANIAGLSPGTYAGTVTITAARQTFPIAVTLTVNATQQSLALSQSGLQFRGASGSGPPPTQSIVVLNQGAAPLTWTATASEPSGNWLSVNPSSGAAGDSASITADPTNLQPGDFYGIVTFTASEAVNSPQIAVVVFHVYPGNCQAACAPGSIPVSVQPTGLIFVAAQGTANTPPQTVTITNSSSESVKLTATPTSQQSGLFSSSISSAVVTAASPAQLMITANVSGLAPGVYTGNLELQFNDGTAQEIALLVIVTPGSSRNSALSASSPACSATKLLPVSTGLSQSFSVAAAWPTPLVVSVVDDCGSAMNAGSVVAAFSSGDPPLALRALGNGSWSGTWQPGYAASPASVVITLAAQSLAPALAGSAFISGTLLPNTIAPAIFPKGVVSTASFAPNAPLAPGAFASIFGVNLSTYPSQAAALPLTTQLGGAQTIVAGRLMPMQYAANGQLNVLIPYDLPPNSTQQLIVLQGTAYSTPETITIAPAQPAVFTQNQSGHGPGAIVVVKPNGTQFNSDATHPASAGDALVIYCTGLGAVNASIQTGAASPRSPAAKINSSVTVTIGGNPAPVSFAGLTPGYAGLYQVNVTVPSGITPGPSVPLILTIGALSSPPVTVAIQ